MRTLWTGSLGFGLVNIPVKLYSGIQDHNLDLDMLHKKDMAPIRYAKMCKEEGEEIPADEIVKGYEYEKGEYVILSDEDFERANVKMTKTVEILSFTDETEVDPNFFEKPYYLEPDKGGDRAYVLLREALKKSGKVGIAQFVIRNREHLGIVRPDGNMLILNQMRFADEIRTPEGLKIPGETEINAKEIDLALTLINHLTEPFKPEAYRDTYTDALKKVIEDKAEGRKPVSQGDSKEQPTKVRDLMAMLKASLEGKSDEKKVPKSGKKEKADPAERTERKSTAARSRRRKVS